MQVLWSEDAERLLLTLAPSHADQIVDTVVTFAETGKGFVRRMLDEPELRLYIFDARSISEATDIGRGKVRKLVDHLRFAAKPGTKVG